MDAFQTEEFDFDSWARLAKQDPDAFETRRREVIARAIDNAPDDSRRRLQGLQFQVDMERRRARTPMAACLRISSMMWHSLVGARGLQSSLNQLLDTLSANDQSSSFERLARQATVINFPARPSISRRN